MTLWSLSGCPLLKGRQSLFTGGSLLADDEELTAGFKLQAYANLDKLHIKMAEQERKFGTEKEIATGHPVVDVYFLCLQFFLLLLICVCGSFCYKK